MFNAFNDTKISNRGKSTKRVSVDMIKERLEFIEKMLNDRYTVKEACDQLGVTPQRYYQMRKTINAL